MVNVDAGFRLSGAYADMVRYAFAPDALPTVIPRLVTLCLAIAFIVLAVAAARLKPDAAGWSDGEPGRRGHRDRGRWWARIVGAPWSTEPGLRHFRASLWHLFRGPVTAKEPPPADLSRRYTELLFENLGQPGFRELIIATLDVETRGDLVFAAIGEARRQAFFQRGRGDLIDLSGVGRSQVFDALAAAMCVPVLTEPHLIVVFTRELLERGVASHLRSHRRGGAIARRAGGGRCRAGDCRVPRLGTLGPASPDEANRVAAIARVRASCGCRDHRRSRRRRAPQEAIQGIVRHSAASQPDRPARLRGHVRRALGQESEPHELIDRGYEDAYRQFVEPVVGGSETRLEILDL